MSERSGARERAEQVNGQASGPVLQSVFLVNLAHNALLLIYSTIFFENVYALLREFSDFPFSQNPL